MTYSIRNAEKKDIKGIYSLVRELAIFEHAEHEVTIDEGYYDTCFEDGTFQSIVAVDTEDKVVGICIYYMTFSTWKGKMLYLEDFVVREECRGSGLGQRLFDAYIDRAKELGCTMTKWQVLDWNEGAIKFYKRNNAIIEKEWWNGKIIF